MSTTGQRAAYAQAAESESKADKQKRSSGPKKKTVKKGKKSLTPTSRKGKNKFSY